MRKLFKSAMILALGVVATAFVSCEKDLTVNKLAGTYTGTFDFDGSDMEGKPVSKTNLPISLNIENGQVVFPAFPISSILSALVGDEAGAGFAALIGKLSYTMSMENIVANSDNFSATLNTPRLRVVVAQGETVIMIVLIDLASPGQLVYTAEGKSLTFVLKTLKFGYEEAGVDNPEMFPLLNTLSFSLVKQ